MSTTWLPSCAAPIGFRAPAMRAAPSRPFAAPGRTNPRYAAHVRGRAIADRVRSASRSCDAWPNPVRTARCVARGLWAHAVQPTIAIGIAGMAAAQHHIAEHLTQGLWAEQRRLLGALLLPHAGTNLSSIEWVRQPPGKPGRKTFAAIIQRIALLRDIETIPISPQAYTPKA